MKQQLNCNSFSVTIDFESDVWSLAAQSRLVESDIVEFEFDFKASEPTPVPHFRISWNFPAIDIIGRWSPNAVRNRAYPPNWSNSETAQLGGGAPVMTLFNANGENRMTFAFSDAMSATAMRCGVNEKTAQTDLSIEAFKVPAAPTRTYHCILRLDTRSIRYESALDAVASWWAAMPEYTPNPAPAAATQIVYSSWYSYHQDLFDCEQEAECLLAKDYGMKSIIVDDGWQTLDNHGGYAFCGDWEMCLKRFPDMAQHVKNVHALGFRYILWYSMPWVGVQSKSYARFQGKYLYLNERLGAAALDPRFPEVREYLIGIYETALTEWDLDGFKLDFVDSFRFEPADYDPALAENYAGRDCKSLSEAVDKLLVGTMTRLRQLKPEIMIEFRQSYTGPAMRKYGNMFRAADCPADSVTNRLRTIDVRLLAGETPVHSDMLMWNYAEPVEIAARQLLNVLFSVPQISVRLQDVTEEHRAMLHFYLNFWKEYRDVLLNGTLRADNPELCYTRVSATKGKRQVVALFTAGSVVEFAPVEGDELCVVNATGKSGIYLELAGAPLRAECFNAVGERQQLSLPIAGLCRVSVPDSGLLKLYF